MGPMGKFSCWRGFSSNGYNVAVLVELSGLAFHSKWFQLTMLTAQVQIRRTDSCEVDSR